jgi:hypothetical protein
VLKHAEVPEGEAEPFTVDMASQAAAFNSGYEKAAFTEDDKTALQLLREHFRKDQEDLKALVDMLYPELNFTVQLETD